MLEKEQSVTSAIFSPKMYDVCLPWGLSKHGPHHGPFYDSEYHLQKYQEKEGKIKELFREKETKETWNEMITPDLEMDYFAIKNIIMITDKTGIWSVDKGGSNTEG